jgi:hypothetical protein
MQYPTVVNVRKAELKKRGYADFEEWTKDEKHLYIGRNMSRYVKGTFSSKWRNPFKVGKDGDIEQVLQLYREHVLENLKDSLHELIELEEIGCWCVNTPRKDTDHCHGDVLIELLKE